MRIVHSRVGNAVSCLDVIRDAVTGALLTTGTVTGILRREFGSFAEATITGISSPIKDPAVTTNPLWNPALNGGSGYNFLVTIPGSMLGAAGVYRATFTIVSGGRDYKISFEIKVASE